MKLAKITKNSPIWQVPFQAVNEKLLIFLDILLLEIGCSICFFLFLKNK